MKYLRKIISFQGIIIKHSLLCSVDSLQSDSVFLFIAVNMDTQETFGVWPVMGQCQLAVAHYQVYTADFLKHTPELLGNGYTPDLKFCT